MASRSSWRGAIEILGFPVNVAFYARVRSTRDQGFKRLIDGQPAKQAYISEADMAKREAHAKPSSLKFRTFTQQECSSGVQVGEQFKVIPEDKVEAIKDRERSRMVSPHRYVSLASVPRELSNSSFVVVPDDKVPGSETSCEQLWNGLLEAGVAYVSQITTRAGSRDSILVLYATEEGLFAEAMPFEAELAEVPEYAFTRDKKVGKRLAALLAADEDTPVGEFEFGAHTSEARAVRAKAIDAAVQGLDIDVPDEAPEPPVKASLIDALEGAVKAKPKKRSRKKVAA